MTLQERIKSDLAAAMKARDDLKKNAIRVIMGEFSRLNRKQLEDDDVVKVLKKLIKAEKETLEKRGGAQDSEYIRFVESYLPQMASEDDIRKWISEHIDFSQYKSKMQAMKPIMANFGSTADGNTVKKILEGL